MCEPFPDELGTIADIQHKGIGHVSSCARLAQCTIKDSLPGGIVVLHRYKRVAGMKSLPKDRKLINRNGPVEHHLTLFLCAFGQEGPPVKSKYTHAEQGKTMRQKFY